ncbi:DUF2141 domain-containing protein [Flectobacillus roseus]|uniref:DUF2141 domain-containing protein n=1 Tax=Flectobacillus roseus TaxID=502259 RepID=UPI00362E802C
MIRKFNILLLLLGLNCVYAHAQNVQVSIRELRNAKGQVILNIYNSEASYDKEQPLKTFKFDKKNAVNGVLSVQLKLEQGEFGIALIDDENENSELDRNSIKVPKEGFGFSDFYLEQLKKPSFNDFKKQIKLDNNNITIRVKYL